jgi:putative flippase GtrA
MRKHIHSTRDLVLPVVDFFYTTFRKLMPLQTFRYAACGSFNLLLGLSAYFVSYTIILKGKGLDLGFYAFKSHSAALFMSACISLPVGFFLMKYVVFTDSNMRGRIQLVRYFMVYLFNLVLNYLFLKILVESVHVHPVFAQIVTTVVIVLFSYVAQRNFTFKIKQEEEDLTG